MSYGNNFPRKSYRQQALQKPLNIDLFQQALEAEHENDIRLAEIIQSSSIHQLERQGLAISGLYISDISSSYEFGYRHVAILKSTESSARWNSSLLRRGSALVLVDKDSETTSKSRLKDPNRHSAVVLDSSPSHIEVLLAKSVSCHNVDLVQETNDSSYARMNGALHDIQTTETYLSESVYLGWTGFKFESGSRGLVPFNKRLDASQLQAARYALAQPITLIHGPPGTGKTSTLIEVLRQFTGRGKRVLVCAASNAALDNIIERVKPSLLNKRLLSRLGNPGRIAPYAREFSLEIKKGRIVTEARSKKSTTSQELTEIAQEFVAKSMKEAKMVFCTLDTSSAEFLMEIPFDVIVIDEVSQATLSQAIIPISKDYGATQLVVAGDSKQLPPTITSFEPFVKEVLEVTLFDLLESYYGNEIVQLLDTQYRMSDAIMRFSSEQLYDNRLKAAASVRNIDLHGLENVRRDEFLKAPIVFVNTNGNSYEQREMGSTSTKNMGEAELVLRYVERLRGCGLQPSQIGVITPYGSQTAAVKRLLPDIDVSTVDGFQGQEREVIVMTMVRSNSSGQVGFLGDQRRLNVAITRAKRHLCVIGDATTLASNTMLGTWTRHIGQRHDMRRPENMFSAASDFGISRLNLF